MNNIQSDLFLGLFDSIKLGDRIRLVDGPGGRGQDAVVTRKGEDGWGRYLKVELDTGESTSVESLTTVGIGAYYVGPPPSPMAN